jgi:L-seryl-tRNA(Ser) seleniumtransferase
MFMSQFPLALLRGLPAVNELLSQPRLAPVIKRHGRQQARDWARKALEEARERIVAGSPALAADQAGFTDMLAARIEQLAARDDERRPARVINATGVVLHTGLGRAPLSRAAVAAIVECSANCNLEFDLLTGQRSKRGDHVARQWRALTGASGALIVNNNAAATVLALDALCRGREVVISRGQLVEIGGSFRLPEIFAQSGALLREVGTTNRTALQDYQRVLGPNTAAILHVHASNFRVVGFAGTPDVADLAQLARAHGLLCIDDLGSGCLVDTCRLGLPPEPTFTQSLTAGCDLVLGSGDKLLGGPQCGIILGRGDLVERLGAHPLARAFRVDKLTLAALAATLDAYLRGAAESEIPLWRLLASPVGQLQRRALALRDHLSASGSAAGHHVRTAMPGLNPELELEVAQDLAAVGGGALPGATLPTCVLRVRRRDMGAHQLAQMLRQGAPRVIPRVRDGDVLIDLRSVLAEDDAGIAQALAALAGLPGAGFPERAE